MENSAIKISPEKIQVYLQKEGITISVDEACAVLQFLQFMAEIYLDQNGEL